jgi:HPt (histidine-containing phosphotransfer) domain-containing protein/PAS domain-containing protein
MNPIAAQRKTARALTGGHAARLRSHATAAGFLVLLAAFIATVLLPGYRLASQLSESTAALKLVSEQRSQPEAMVRSLATIKDRLRSGGYVGDSIAELAASRREYDLALAQLGKTGTPGSVELQRTEKAWKEYRALLEPVAAFSGVPYVDSDRSGTQLNASGERLMADTRKSLDYGRKNSARMSGAMTAIGARLESESVDGAATLRRLMIAGMLFAGLLLALVARFHWLKAREERAANDARRQTRDIMDTVKEGLFLIDRDFRIGTTHSAALAALFRRDSFEGLTFEDLLRGVVSDATLETASKYVKLLWGDRANENLIKSINPLAEVEVDFGHGHGGRDTRYLEFDFHRVKQDGGVRQVLVSVSDVTSRVMLAREVKQSAASADAQMDLLLAILQVEPGQLEAFLSDSNAALRMVNSVMKVPARGDADFRKKVDLLFREMHKIKGDAATLGIATMESRAHGFEDSLKELRERTELSGNDFLPLVVRLDDMFAHLKVIQELFSRFDNLRAASVLGAPPAAAASTSTLAPLPAPGPARSLAGTLESLAARIASDHGKQVRLVTNGLEQVPGDYLRAVQNVVIQFVRNAVVHGVEDAGLRSSAGKDPTGLLQVDFKSGENGFELTFQDDGAGIRADLVREKAVALGIIDPASAQTLDERSTLGLIFKAGISTHAGDDRDAGRGVGLDLVLKSVHELGGKIAVATVPGRMTRFRLLLPAQDERRDAVA